MKSAIAFAVFAALSFSGRIGSCAEPDQAKRATWLGAAAYNIAVNGYWLEAESLGQIADAYRAYPDYSEESARANIEISRQQRQKAFTFTTSPQAQFSHDFYESLKGIGAQWNAYSVFAQSQVRQYNQSQADQAFWRYDSTLNAAARSQPSDLFETLNNAYELTQSNSNFRELYDGYFGHLIGVFSDDTTEEIITRNPDFYQFSLAQEAIDSQGTLKVGVDALRQDLGKKFEELSAGMDNYRSDIYSLMDLEYRDREERRANFELAKEAALREAEARRSAEQEKIRLAGLRAGSYLIAGLIANPEERMRFVATTEAALGIYDAFREYKASLASAGDAESSGWGLVIMTASFVSAYQQLSGAFSNKGPSADEIVLKQLDAMVKQIEQFRIEAHDRFDRIDQSLATLYTEMTQSFYSLNQAIAVAQSDITDVKNTLSAIAPKLDAMRAELLNYLKATIDQNYLEKMKECLGYKDRTGQDMTFSTYDECVVSILSYIELAREPATSSDWYPNESVATMLARVEDSRAPELINFYRGFGNRYGNFNFQGRRANPTRWQMAASAYIRLAEENAKWFHTAPLTALLQIKQEGDLLSQELAFEFTAGAPKSFLLMWKSAHDIYLQTVADLKTRIDKVRHDALTAEGVVLPNVWIVNPNESDYVAAERAYLEAMLSRQVPHMSIDDGKSIVSGRSEFPQYGAAPTYLPKLPIGGTAGFPQLGAPRSAWSDLLGETSIQRMEILGLGVLQVDYAFIWEKPHFTELNNNVWWWWGQPALVARLTLHSKDGSVSNLRAGYARIPISIWAFSKVGGSSFLALKFDKLPDMHQYLKEVGTYGFGRLKVVDIAADVGARVDKRHREILRRIQNLLIQEFATDGSPLRAASEQVEAASNLLRHLAELTLRQAIQHNDTLRSMLFGGVCEDRLVDGPLTQQPSDRLLRDCSRDAALLDRYNIGNMLSVAKGDATAPEDYRTSTLSTIDVQAEASLAQIWAEISKEVDLSRSQPQYDPAIVGALGALESLRLSHSGMFE